MILLNKLFHGSFGSFPRRFRSSKLLSGLVSYRKYSCIFSKNIEKICANPLNLCHPCHPWKELGVNNFFVHRWHR
jgi:hypothetical protein